MNFEERISFDDEAFAIPMTMRLKSVKETEVGVRLFVNLGPLQDAMPDLLDEPLYADCNDGILMDLSDVKAIEDTVFLAGTIVYSSYSCREEDGKTLRSRTFKQDVDFSGRLRANIVSNCIVFETQEMKFSAQGLIPFLAKLVGALDGFDEHIEEQINTFFAEEPLCFDDFPPELSILNPRLVSGGLRDFGDGLLGAQVSGRVDVNAYTVIGLISQLHEQGLLEPPECNC